MTLANILRAIVNLILSIVGVILGLRILLKLFSANADNAFVQWVYEQSGEILGPFRGIFPAPSIDGFTIDFTAIFGLLVYGLTGMLAFYAIDILTPGEAVSSRKKR